jgi:signal transduction histidine kinase/CheY-like chemotaxis protein
MPDLLPLGSAELLGAISVTLLTVVLVMVQRLRRAARAAASQSDALLQTARQQGAQLAARLACAEQSAPATSPFTGALTRRLGAIDALAYSIAGDLRRALQEKNPDVLRAAAERVVRRAEQLAGLASGGRARDVQTSLPGIWSRVPGLVGHKLAGISLVARFAPDLPPVVGAGELWAQVLSALVENAAEASSEGSHIEVGAAVVSGGPGHVCIWVEDHGRGIAPGLLPHVMEPFHSSRAEEGIAALGLALIVAIVESMNGTVTVASAIGVGTRVEITVPHVGPAARAPTPLRFAGTVLVADDDSVVRGATRRALQRMGLDVVEADSGSSARTALTGHPDRFRVAILDVVMPGLPVSEVVAMARRGQPDLPVLLVSGYNTESMVDSILAMGGVRFLHKPYDLNQLAQSLDDLMALPQAASPEPAAGTA